jgi:HSP20 family molecular chaperone IbpA
MMLNTRLTSVVFVAVFGLLGYFLYQSDKENQQLATKIDTLQSQINTLIAQNNSAAVSNSQKLQPISASQVVKAPQVVSKSPQVVSNLQNIQSDPMASFNAMREEMHKQMQSMFGNQGADAFFNDDFFKDHFKHFDTLRQNGLRNFSTPRGLKYDIEEKDHNYLIEFSSPNKDDLNVNIELKNGNLIVKEEKSNKSSKQEKDSYFSSQTFSSSSISIPLPHDADTHYTTKMEDGKLVVVVPKLG